MSGCFRVLSTTQNQPSRGILKRRCSKNFGKFPREQPEPGSLTRKTCQTFSKHRFSVLPKGCFWILGDTLKQPIANIFHLSYSDGSLTLPWRKSLSYRSHSIDLLCKSIDWFLNNRDLRLKSVHDDLWSTHKFKLDELSKWFR